MVVLLIEVLDDGKCLKEGGSIVQVADKGSLGGKQDGMFQGNPSSFKHWDLNLTGMAFSK